MLRTCPSRNALAFGTLNNGLPPGQAACRKLARKGETLCNKRLAILLIIGLCAWTPSALGYQKVVERASGNGNSVVGPFTVGDRWEVRWDFEVYPFQIFVNQKDAVYPDLPVEDATQEGSGRGSFTQRKPGTYYLKVVAQGSWTVTVVDQP